MNFIEPVTILDGNQYRIDNPVNTASQATSFDDVYNRSCGDATLDEIFESVADEYGVNVNLLKAVAQAESGFDPNATSWCGAMGIMQLMPSTAAAYGVEDPYDPRQSITGGAKLLSWLLDDYNGNVTLALAGYNAGCGAVQKYGGVPPYEETLNYINKINDILGGALSNDSTTIDGTKPTDLTNSYVSTGDAGSVYYPGLSSGTEVHAISSDSVRLSGMADSSDTSDNNILSYEQYQYFVNTIKELLEKILEGEDAGDANKTGGITAEKNTDRQIPKVQESQDSFSVSDINTEWVNKVVMPATAQAFDNIIKTSPQSLYEAQASAVSPLVAQLLEL